MVDKAFKLRGMITVKDILKSIHRYRPTLYPGVGSWLRITQQELGYLVGLSRQRVNQALHRLSDAKLIRIEYGGLRVLDLAGLRLFPD